MVDRVTVKVTGLVKLVAAKRVKGRKAVTNKAKGNRAVASQVKVKRRLAKSNLGRGMDLLSQEVDLLAPHLPF